MAGGWRRIIDDIRAVFHVEGCLEDQELEHLSQDLQAAVGGGARHLVLDLTGSCEQSLQQWGFFRRTVEDITRRGARLQVEGGNSDLLEGLRYAAAEAEMRWLETQHPNFFLKKLS